MDWCNLNLNVDKRFLASTSNCIPDFVFISLLNCLQISFFFLLFLYFFHVSFIIFPLNSGEGEQLLAIRVYIYSCIAWYRNKTSTLLVKSGIVISGSCFILPPDFFFKVNLKTFITSNERVFTSKHFIKNNTLYH